MSDEKAARLAAIRERNAAKAASAAAPAAPADDKAARLAAIRERNAAKAASAAASAAPADDKAARLAAIRQQNAAKAAPAAAPARAAKPARQVAPADMWDQDMISAQTLIWLLVATGVGVLVALWLMPLLVPSLGASLTGPAPHAYWYLSRSSAIVAYVLLWMSMVFGLSLSGRVARLWPGGPTALSIHQHTSLLAMLFSVFHAVILIGDKYIDFSLATVFQPFRAPYEPLWVGFGQLALYGLIIVFGSFYVRRWIGRRAWRLIHYLSFAIFLMGLGHGIFSGTDTSNPAITWMYWASGGSVLFLLMYRVLVSLPSARTAPQR